MMIMSLHISVGSAHQWTDFPLDRPQSQCFTVNWNDQSVWSSWRCVNTVNTGCVCCASIHAVANEKMWHTDSDQVEENIAWRGVVTAVHEGRFGHASVASLWTEGLWLLTTWPDTLRKQYASKTQLIYRHIHFKFIDEMKFKEQKTLSITVPHFSLTVLQQSLTSSLSSRSLFRAPTGLPRSLNVAAFVMSEKTQTQTISCENNLEPLLCHLMWSGCFSLLWTHPAVHCCSRRGPMERRDTGRGHCSCGQPDCWGEGDTGSCSDGRAATAACSSLLCAPSHGSLSDREGKQQGQVGHVLQCFNIIGYRMQRPIFWINSWHSA